MAKKLHVFGEFGNNSVNFKYFENFLKKKFILFYRLLMSISSNREYVNVFMFLKDNVG